MPFVSAKCTQCGANLEVDLTCDAAICSACDMPFIVEKAIHNYNTSVRTDTAVVINSLSRDFEIRAGVLVKYHGATIDVIVPEGVLEIGEKAFQGCSRLRSVVCPEGVIKVSEYTFDGCECLECVNLPESLRMLNITAFRGCDGIKELSISRDMAASVLYHNGYAYGLDGFSNNLYSIIFEMLIKRAYPQFICPVCNSAKGYRLSRKCKSCGSRFDFNGIHHPPKPKVFCRFCGNEIFPDSGGAIARYCDSCSKCGKWENLDSRKRGHQ